MRGGEPIQPGPGQTSMFGDAASVAVAPVTPYAGGSVGHVAVPASVARAGRARPGASQSAVVNVLQMAGEHGVTVVELRGMAGWHHGKASGALSNLHKGNVAACLVEQRRGCHVYVLPSFVDGRATRGPARTSAGVAGRVARCQTQDERGAHGERTILRSRHPNRVWLDGRSYVTAAALLAALRGGE